MTLESIGIAVTILLAVATASIKIIESIVHQTTARKFDQIKEELGDDLQKSRDELQKSSRRINRLERRVAILETKVLGDSDTFGSD